MKLENSKVCNHQICAPRSCCKLGLGDEFPVWSERTQYSIHHHKSFISRPWWLTCTLWRRFPLLTVALWESVSVYLKKKYITKEEKRFTFLEVLASTGQTESWFGSFHANPEYRVFSEIPEAPSLRRKLACHPRTFGTKSWCWNSVWNPSAFFPTRDMNNHNPIANRVSFPVVMSNSDMWLKWSFIGHIIYHNMWYKMKTMFPTISLSIVNLGFLCFPNIK